MKPLLTDEMLHREVRALLSQKSTLSVNYNDCFRQTEVNKYITLKGSSIEMKIALLWCVPNAIIP